MTRKRVLYREMEITTLLPLLLSGEARGEVKNRKISGSPPDVPSSDHLSLRKKTLPQHRVSNEADKKQRMAKIDVIASTECNEVRGNLQAKGDRFVAKPALSLSKGTLIAMTQQFKKSEDP